MRASVALFLTAIACGGGEPITVVTYNGGLATGFVDGAESRLDSVGATVAGFDADVVCLQEIWAPDQVAAVQAATEGAFPHQLWPEAYQTSQPEPGCSTEDMDKLLGCVDRVCSELCDEYLDDCMLDNCAISFINASASCQGCVMANVGGDVADVQAACSTNYPEYAYDGAFGTALLSKHEILSSEHRELPATTNRRGIHHAVIDSPAGKVDVYCTHLTAVFTLLPYPKETGDWDEEQRAQAAAMISFVEETAQTKRVVLLGDFNAGPAIGDSVTEVEIETYDTFVAAGYDDPYVRLSGECTWCSDNPLIGGGDDQVIDHVFVSGMDGDHTASRVGDEPIDVDVCDETSSAFASDHFGVSVTLVP